MLRNVPRKHDYKPPATTLIAFWTGVVSGLRMCSCFIDSRVEETLDSSESGSKDTATASATKDTQASSGSGSK